MRAIVVMFDSLNRRHLQPYDSSCETLTPNFSRLAERTAQFRHCYAGSMPCIPARREMHTGRYNFLHRSWGPLEPFDDSAPRLLCQNDVHTHLVTDHLHYWEDGGANYHTRYSTFEFVRGQQGDPWKGDLALKNLSAKRDSLRVARSAGWQQDFVNRQYQPTPREHPQTQTFDAGLEFIHTNAGEDNWMVQIETFDPHEPFFVHDEWLAEYPGDYAGPEFDWPDVMQVIEDDAASDHLRRHYAALVSMCDSSLGRVLDAMDELQLWDDTMLIVCTDHGFLLGEQGWWGKSTPPWYDETIHTPLFIWDPRSAVAGDERHSLVQTIDLPATLLDFFDVASPPDMAGQPLRDSVATDTPVREYALFGAFGGHVNVTDGRYVYMRAPIGEDNTPLYEHTLMPSHMRAPFTADELCAAELSGPFGFTKSMPVLRMPGSAATNPFVFGTLLFDLQEDPRQQQPIVDDDVELRMAAAMAELMRQNEAPGDQFERIGLPVDGPVEHRHLLARAQFEQATQSRRPAPPASAYPDSPRSVHQSLNELLADPDAAAVLNRHAPHVTTGVMATITAGVSLYRAASLAIGILPWATLDRIAADLAALPERPRAT